MTHSMDAMLSMLQKYLVFDLVDHFSEVRFRDENNLIQVMKDIYNKTKCSFIILIDEWDCLFREYQQDQDAQKKYLDFLRAWLKDKDYVALAYMTGILPINIGTFSNDMTTFACKDDVLTLLIHLGYLTYDSVNGTVMIPNKEVSQEYVNAISTMNWKGVVDSVEASRKLLESLWEIKRHECIIESVCK